MKRNILGWLVMLAIAPQLSRGSTIDWMSQTPAGDSDAVDTGDDQWMEDRDWGYNQNNVWMNETWVGGFGSYFGVDMWIEVSADRTVTPISISKNVMNTTSFNWTDFHIDILPNPSGGAISNVNASPNAAFGNVMVMDNLDGSFSIWWDNFTGGSGVPIGDNTTLPFSFDIDGSIGFKIRQTPTPEPATLALLAMGGLAMIRRRR